MGENEEVLSVRDFELAKYACEMMAHGNIADGESISNILVFQSQSHEAYDFAFSGGQAVDIWRPGAGD